MRGHSSWRWGSAAGESGAGPGQRIRFGARAAGFLIHPLRLLTRQLLTWALVLACLPAALACTHTVHNSDGSGGLGSIGGSFGGFGSIGGVGGAVGTGASFGGTGASFGGGGIGGCTPPDLYALELQEQYVEPYQPRATTLYAWISPEDEAALRAGGPLFSADEGVERPRPFSIEQLAAWGLGHPDDLEAALMPAFEHARSAWPHPWPVAFSPTGEDTGARLLKMDLASEAWIARLAEHGAIWEVYDIAGNIISLDVARQTPERIALLFFIHLGEVGNNNCGSREQVVTGPAYREFIVGNPAMLTSYEVGSEAILQELGGNISALSEYMERTRPCPRTLFEPFEASLVCSWGYWGDPFIDGLTNAAEAYRPTASALADLIERLEDALFEVDPFVVTGEASP